MTEDVRAKYTADQITAVGEEALRSLHDLSNPLATVFAEAQLLAMESLTPDQKAATDRIVEHCRRAVQAVRRIEGAAKVPLAL